MSSPPEKAGWRYGWTPGDHHVFRRADGRIKLISGKMGDDVCGNYGAFRSKLVLMAQAESTESQLPYLFPTTAESPISRAFVTPINFIVVTISACSNSSTRSTPACPNAPKPQM